MPKLKANGAPLMRDGVPALDDTCCCGEGVCCTFDPARALYLTLDNFAIDGGDTCDPDCDTFTIAGKVNFGGTTGSSNLVTWFTFVCAEDEPYRVAYTLVCEGGLHYVNMFSGAASAVIDNCIDNNVQCFIVLPGAGNHLLGDGIAVCDPFFIQATLAVDIYDPDGVTQCGTGTLRFTITE